MSGPEACLHASDSNLKGSLHDLFGKFLTFRSLDPHIGVDEIREKVSVKNIEYYEVDAKVFHEVLDALFHGTALSISYHTPHKGEVSERIIQPLHLLCYMGSWHLIAYCTLKEGLRDFSLSRITKIYPLDQKIRFPQWLSSVKDFIDKNFGLMSGETSVEVHLKFAPKISQWVSEQVWYQGQEASTDADGSLSLKFPVADLKEVRREILKYGAGVEVISLAALREEIKREIETMSKVYRDKPPPSPREMMKEDPR